MKYKVYLMLILLTSDVTLAKGETPAQAVDRILKFRTEGNPSEADCFKFGKEIADEQGTAIIAPIIARAKDWKGEEVLYFTTTVIALPPQKGMPILIWYFQNGKPWEKTCANDLLTEWQDWLSEHPQISDADLAKLFKGWE